MLLQVAFFTSCLEIPIGNAAVGTRTMLYSISNRMFANELFVDAITWTGKSPRGERVKFESFENIFRCVHKIVLSYNASFTLDAVKNFFKKSIVKNAKARSNNTNQRKSSARNLRGQNKGNRMSVLTQQVLASHAENEGEKRNENDEGDQSIDAENEEEVDMFADEADDEDEESEKRRNSIESSAARDDEAKKTKHV